VGIDTAGQTVTAVATALRAGQQAIPVLVEGVSMPSEEELPAGIGALATTNAFSLHDDAFARRRVSAARSHPQPG